jgi:PucR C-terminal helix-turn-helix domain
VAGVAWEALFDALDARRSEIAQLIRAQMQEQLPAYAAVPATELEDGIALELDEVLRSARAGKNDVSAQQVTALASVGQARARQGLPLDEMLRAWRIGIQVVVSEARNAAQTVAASDAELLDFVESILAWADVAMVTTAAGHRETELQLAREDEARKAMFVRGLLLGTLSTVEAHTLAPAYGVDPDTEYVAIRAEPNGDVSLSDLDRALGFDTALPHRTGLSTLIDGDLAGFLRKPPGAEINGIAGVGEPAPIDRLAESFRLASRALLAAKGFGLSGVHDVHSLGVRAAIASDKQVGDALRARYLDPLSDSTALADIVTSLRAYFEAGMHIDRAAKRLFVHPNTLRNRIARFETLADVSLRDPRAAFEVWWALERYSLDDIANAAH